MTIFVRSNICDYSQSIHEQSMNRGAQKVVLEMYFFCRLKCHCGRIVLSIFDSDSTQAVADESRSIPELQAARTYVHYSQSVDAGSTRTV